VSILLSAQRLSLDYGANRIFSDLNFSIHAGVRCGLIGPNGAGKSSLLKILAGIEQPSDGELIKRKGIKVAYLAQESKSFDGSVLELVMQSSSGSDAAERHRHALRVLKELDFVNPEEPVSILSGGWRKRADLAAALAADPELLLLDEPTNHLDVESIEWLEQLLKRASYAFMVSTHDRAFLDSVCNQILEINKRFESGILECKGGYKAFTEYRDRVEAAQNEQERSLKGQARRAEAWRGRSAPARTAKSEARVSGNAEIIEQYQELKRRNREPVPQIGFTSTERNTHKLLTAHNIGMAHGDRWLFRGINLTLSPGSRLALIGANGVGKSTLLRILSGEMGPKMGQIKRADDLKQSVFDQHRLSLPLEISLKQALCPEGDFVNYAGRQIHVHAWAKRFLFPPERLVQPIAVLSGGERARILLARFMTESADILFLDEPTNDLDIPTLESMETALRSFPGAVVIISHDRALIDAVANQILVLDGEGGYHLVSSQKQAQAIMKGSLKEGAAVAAKEPAASERKPEAPRRKLSYNEQRRLAELEQLIPQKEQLSAQLAQHLEKRGHALSAAELGEICRELAQLTATLEAYYYEWEELDRPPS